MPFPRAHCAHRGSARPRPSMSTPPGDSPRLREVFALRGYPVTRRAPTVCQDCLALGDQRLHPAQQQAGTTAHEGGTPQ